MKTLNPDIVEEQVVAVVKEICEALKIEVVIDGEFCPGNFIKSQVLLDTISTIEDALGITIPNEHYVFSEKKKQLSVKEAVQKIIKVAKDGK